MIITYDDSFIKNLERIKNAILLKRVEQAVERLFVAKSLHEIANVKAMQGYPGFYRYRFGDFRIGFRLIDKNTIKLLILEHHSKVYRHFPGKYL